MKKMHIRFLSSFLSILCLSIFDVSSWRTEQKLGVLLNGKGNSRVYTRPKIWRCWKQVGEGSFGKVYKIDDKRALKIVESGRRPLLDADEFEGERKNLAFMKVLGNEIVKGKRGYFCAPSRVTCARDFCQCQAEFDLAISDAYGALEKVYMQCRSIRDWKVMNIFLETLIVHTLNGLDGLHEQGVYHGDLKLENILLFLENNRLKFKLCDMSLENPFTIGIYLNFNQKCLGLVAMKNLLSNLESSGCCDNKLRNKIIEQSRYFKRVCNDERCDRHFTYYIDFLRKFDIKHFVTHLLYTLNRYKLKSNCYNIVDVLQEIAECDTVKQALNLKSVKEMIKRVKYYERKHDYDWNRIFEVEENDEKETKIVNCWVKKKKLR